MYRAPFRARRAHRRARNGQMRTHPVSTFRPRAVVEPRGPESRRIICCGSVQLATATAHGAMHCVTAGTAEESRRRRRRVRRRMERDGPCPPAEHSRLATVQVLNATRQIEASTSGMGPFWRRPLHDEHSVELVRTYLSAKIHAF
jgi:hypothetical protein